MLEIDTPYEMPNGNVLTVKYDECPDSPRNWDNLSTFVTFESRNYSPDKNDFESFQELYEMVQSDKYIYSLVEKYEHSAVSYYRHNGSLRCQWDSGVVGIIFVSKEDIRKNYNVKRVTKKILEKVYNVFDGELETYTDYCNGAVYGYVIENMEGEIIDSCWGFYGYDDLDTILEYANVKEEDLKEVEKVTTYHYKRV